MEIGMSSTDQTRYKRRATKRTMLFVKHHGKRCRTCAHYGVGVSRHGYPLAPKHSRAPCQHPDPDLRGVYRNPAEGDGCKGWALRAIMPESRVPSVDSGEPT